MLFAQQVTLSHLQYALQYRETLKSSSEGQVKLGIAEQSAEIGRAWNLLPESDKKPYTLAYEHARQQYDIHVKGVRDSRKDAYLEQVNHTFV
ncbi:hypothetical protein FGO68_gene13815 [Halteria grandinella]|uniref:HMG box domain-containing protein n=1 Tax=Halteria grandinella TaxID=5974 RepID=A0A8J8NVP4_HALGN|nr:hypothetical protein FGO68_gene13815 [Halteria grandinella]